MYRQIRKFVIWNNNTMHLFNIIFDFESSTLSKAAKKGILARMCDWNCNDQPQAAQLLQRETRQLGRKLCTSCRAEHAWLSKPALGMKG